MKEWIYILCYEEDYVSAVARERRAELVEYQPPESYGTNRFFIDGDHCRFSEETEICHDGLLQLLGIRLNPGEYIEFRKTPVYPPGTVTTQRECY